MADTLFRLRINYQKRGQLRFLSHLETIRALERIIRRAGLPFAVSQGFNVHMRFAPGPALPVGTEGWDEYFDVLLTEYVKPQEVLASLRSVTVEDIPLCAVSYVDPKVKGLQATHVYETYRVALRPKDLSADGIAACLRELIETGELRVPRKNKEKTYDLTRAFEGCDPLRVKGDADLVVVEMTMKSTEQGSLRPDDLILAGLGKEWKQSIISLARIRLSEEDA